MHNPVGWILAGLLGGLVFFIAAAVVLYDVVKGGGSRD